MTTLISPRRRVVGYLRTTVTPRWVRIGMFVLGIAWTGFGVWVLVDGEYAKGGFYLALGIGWLLMTFFRDRYAPWAQATLERQRSEVHGQGAITFLPDSNSRSNDPA